MEIKTKYNIGDTVFFIKDGRIKSGTIERVHVMEDTKNAIELESGEVFSRNIVTVIQYYIGFHYYDEYMVDASRGELIKRLVYGYKDKI